MMEIQSIIIDACITIFALGLFVVSMVSYRKYNNKKLLFVSLVFVIFVIKGIMLSLSLFNAEFADFMSNPIIGLFDLVILILLFMATLKR